MTAYLISFPAAAMVVAAEDMQTVEAESHAVVREAKAAGVWRFGGGINGSVPPVMVSADGTVAERTYEQTRRLDGGFAILDLPTREEALRWAARFASACRCAQEVREFGFDPES